VVDRPIKGPGHDAPPAKKPGVPSSKRAVTEAIQSAMIAPAVVMEETVQAAAARLGITHDLILRGMLEEAQHPYATSAERIAAWRTLGEWCGTAKAPPAVHNHLHAYLERVPTDTLEARLAKIVGGIIE
jgi:hypothetical protein